MIKKCAGYKKTPGQHNLSLVCHVFLTVTSLRSKAIFNSDVGCDSNETDSIFLYLNPQPTL